MQDLDDFEDYEDEDDYEEYKVRESTEKEKEKWKKPFNDNSYSSNPSYSSKSPQSKKTPFKDKSKEETPPPIINKNNYIKEDKFEIESEEEENEIKLNYSDDSLKMKRNISPSPANSFTKDLFPESAITKKFNPEIESKTLNIPKFEKYDHHSKNDISNSNVNFTSIYSNSSYQKHLNVENEHLKSHKSQIELENKLANNHLIENQNKINKKINEIKNKKSEKELIDNEIDELKNEINRVETEIKVVRERSVQSKISRNHSIASSGRSVENFRQTGDISTLLKQKDAEIEKYKRAYQNLKQKWESSVNNDDPIDNQHNKFIFSPLRADKEEECSWSDIRKKKKRNRKLPKDIPKPRRNSARKEISNNKGGFELGRRYSTQSFKFNEGNRGYSVNNEDNYSLGVNERNREYPRGTEYISTVTSVYGESPRFYGENLNLEKKSGYNDYNNDYGLDERNKKYELKLDFLREENTKKIPEMETIKRTTETKRSSRSIRETVDLSNPTSYIDRYLTRIKSERNTEEIKPEFEERINLGNLKIPVKPVERSIREDFPLFKTRSNYISEFTIDNKNKYSNYNDDNNYYSYLNGGNMKKSDTENYRNKEDKGYKSLSKDIDNVINNLKSSQRSSSFLKNSGSYLNNYGTRNNEYREQRGSYYTETLKNGSYYNKNYNTIEENNATFRGYSGYKSEIGDQGGGYLYQFKKDDLGASGFDLDDRLRRLKSLSYNGR